MGACRRAWWLATRRQVEPGCGGVGSPRTPDAVDALPSDPPLEPDLPAPRPGVHLLGLRPIRCGTAPARSPGLFVS